MIYAGGGGLFAGGPFAAGLISGGLFASGLNAVPQLHAVTASDSGDRYFCNDVNHSMGPALIGEEIDDSVDLTPGDMFHHIVVYWGRCLQFP